MKKILALIMATLLIVTLSACGGKPATSDIKDPLELLTTVWNGYAEEDKFPAAGGDEANSVMQGPGVYGIEDAEAIDYMLGFPPSSVEKIDGAASLTHMMNLNTFTAGAYHVKNSADTLGLVTEIKDNILNRQWMCGFPDKLIVVTIDDLYIVSAFGKNEPIDKFLANIIAAYPQAKTVVDATIEA